MFHSSNPTLFGRPPGVLADADALASAVSTLREVGISLQGGGISARALSASHALTRISDHLSAYLDAEEGSGYLNAIGAQSALFRFRVNALETAHRELRDAVSSAEQWAAVLSDSDAPEFGRRIANIVDQLEQHDEAERDLFQDFFLQYRP
jgi:hypothetical protein